MGVNSLPKTVTQQRRGCDLNPGLTAPEFSYGATLTDSVVRKISAISKNTGTFPPMMLCGCVAKAE